MGVVGLKDSFLIGEALVGEGSEVAHIDLLMGEKTGPVGDAFASAMSHLSSGHTPLLAVIRPNLISKPATLIIPKVTVKGMEDTEKIFGPAQSAVAKAVADSLEEGNIPKEMVDDWVILCSVFIHPQAKDYNKIYHYNYSATKLALKRALTNYPPVEKIMYDKDRASHPIMGFKVPRLWRPPYLQIALDVPSLDNVKKVLNQVPRNDSIILEAGTPLIKKYGLRVIREIKEMAKDKFIVADLKTLDVGNVEVDLAQAETADGAVVSGLATNETIDGFIYECKKLGIYAIVDMLNVEDPVAKLKSMNTLPDVVLLHRSIDTELSGGKETKTREQMIKEIKTTFKDKKILVAAAGGIRPDTARECLKSGADILVVGRHITQSKDVEKSTRDFLGLLSGDVDLYRVHEDKD